MALTLKTKNVITKKEHTCYSCLRKFPSKTEMNYWAGIYEGDFNSVYSCMTCVQVMKDSRETEFPEGFVDSMLLKDETPEQLLKRWNLEF